MYLLSGLLIPNRNTVLRHAVLNSPQTASPTSIPTPAEERHHTGAQSKASHGRNERHLSLQLFIAV